MMAKGGYNGGSTLVRPGSSWFSKGKPKATKKTPLVASEASLQQRIEQAAEKLAKTQADFDCGRMKSKMPKPSPVRMSKKKRKKLKLAAKRAKKLT